MGDTRKGKGRKSKSRRWDHFEKSDGEADFARSKRDTRKKSVKIVEGDREDGKPRQLFGAKTDLTPGKPLKSALSNKSGHYDEPSRSRSRGPSNRRTPVGPVSPRRQIFEAKYEKFLANKSQKTVIEKRAAAIKVPDFDITTKGT
jgi:hypothetical protein